MYIIYASLSQTQIYNFWFAGTREVKKWNLFAFISVDLASICITQHSLLYHTDFTGASPVEWQVIVVTGN